MKYLKKSAFLIVCAAAAFFLLFAITEGLTPLLIFPIAALAAFAALYLVKQGERDKENNIKDGVRYTVENEEAEHWVKHDLAPHTLSYIQHKHWPIIIYSFIFVVGVAFLWSFLTIGPESAIANSVYAAVLFVIVTVYAFIAPLLFNRLFKHIPKKHRSFARNDWIRGYLFLLPLSAIAYILSPFIGKESDILSRVTALPSFLLGYTLLFIAGYAIMYLHMDTKREEEKELKKSVKEYLSEGEGESVKR
jgi:hypothetical protein